ncbi:DUF5684 domain-containing protein [Microbacterium sp.]|uniref:DUF5684 domain-containing protein n=1 Tax=Microbacterium sp. TaxID=51671 RepID=UPI003340E8F2
MTSHLDLSTTNGVQELFGAIFSGTTGVVALIFHIIVAIGLWRVFSKAGYPGILAIIPLVNLIFLVKVAGMTGWAVLLYLIPLVNVIFAIVVAFKLGARFGKGGGFSFFLLWLLPFIGYIVLGFGGAQYRRA